MDSPNQILELIIALLFLATLVGLLSRRFRLPYTVGLVLMGLVLGMVNRRELISLPETLADIVPQVEQTFTPELILALLVTPLIFEAAFHLRWEDLRRDLYLILALAVPGVVLTTLMVGGIISLGFSDFALPAALVFGALMAAIDPVAVIALFRSLGVPRRLQVLMEGESLFNDGTAIVVFSLMLSIAKGTVGEEASPALLENLANFIRVVGGGLAVGLMLGWLINEMIRRIDDHLIEATLTAVVAFGSYLIAEQLHVSGVLAVVAAGLISGNIGPRGMAPTSRIVVANFWEIAAFLSNSFIFLVIGLEMNLAEMFLLWQPILVAILAVLVSRAVIIYGLSWIGKDIPWRWNHVLLWGGLRGAISLALAITLPEQLGSSGEQLRVMAFGVVLFTVVVQGFSMQFLVQRMGLVQRSEMEDEYERRHARAVAARAAYDRLQEMARGGLFSQHTWQLISPMIEEHANALAGAVKEVVEADPLVEAEELDTARREALRAQRSALISLLTDGIVSEENYQILAREVDNAITESSHSWAGLLKPSRLHEVAYLMTAVIQLQDFESALRALHDAGFTLTHLSSSGGFLGQRNVTLLIGIGAEQHMLAVETLERACRKRVEYVAQPLEGAPFHLPLSTPVTVGGATIFTFTVERYEEF